MSAPRVHIGRAYGHQGLRTARTLNEAFGPTARLHVERSGPVIRDRTIGVVCGLIVVVALAFVALGG